MQVLIQEVKLVVSLRCYFTLYLWYRWVASLRHDSGLLMVKHMHTVREKAQSDEKGNDTETATTMYGAL